MFRRKLRLEQPQPPEVTLKPPARPGPPSFKMRMHSETFKCENGHVYSGLSASRRYEILDQEGRVIENVCPHCDLAVYYYNKESYEAQVKARKWFFDRQKFKLPRQLPKIRVKTTP